MLKKNKVNPKWQTPENLNDPVLGGGTFHHYLHCLNPWWVSESLAAAVAGKYIGGYCSADIARWPIFQTIELMGWSD